MQFLCFIGDIFAEILILRCLVNGWNKTGTPHNQLRSFCNFCPHSIEFLVHYLSMNVFRLKKRSSDHYWFQQRSYRNAQKFFVLVTRMYNIWDQRKTVLRIHSIFKFQCWNEGKRPKCTMKIHPNRSCQTYSLWSVMFYLYTYMHFDTDKQNSAQNQKRNHLFLCEDSQARHASSCRVSIFPND